MDHGGGQLPGTLLPCRTVGREELHWGLLGRKIPIRKRCLLKGPHGWLLYSGQILDHFLPFSPVCWQVKRRINSLSCKLLTQRSTETPSYNTEIHWEFKPQLTQSLGSTQFFLLSVRHTSSLQETDDTSKHLRVRSGHIVTPAEAFRYQV